MDRSDIDRVEDNLRSNLESLRGIIDRIKDDQSDRIKRIAILETQMISINENIDRHDNKISKLYFLLLSILITIIVVLGSIVGGII